MLYILATFPVFHLDTSSLKLSILSNSSSIFVTYDTRPKFVRIPLEGRALQDCFGSGINIVAITLYKLILWLGLAREEKLSRPS